MRFSGVLFVVFLLFFVFVDYSLASNLSDAFSTKILGGFGNNAGYNTSVSGPEPVIATVISVALSLIGVIFLILMIYGGYLWMTAAGSDEKIKRSQNIITGAIIGLVVVVSAYAISSFVIKSLEGGAINESVGGTSAG